MTTPAEINALIEYSEATELDWNALVVPIPERMLALAQGTNEFKIGNGIDTFNNLEVAFDVDNRGIIQVKVDYLPTLSAENANKLIVVNEDGTAFVVSNYVLNDFILHSTLTSQIANYSSTDHTHDGIYLLKADVDAVLTEGFETGSSTLDTQDVISYLVAEKAMRDSVIVDLPSGYMDEYVTDAYIDLSLCENVKHDATATTITQSYWTTRKPFPTDFPVANFTTHELNMHINGSKLYICGGLVDSVYTGIFKSYDLLTGEVVEYTDCPVSVANAGLVYHDGALYLIGGSNSDYTNFSSKLCYRYVFATNTWEQLTSCPYTVSESLCEVYNNEIYVVCGLTNSTASSYTLKYNPTTNTWTTLLAATAALRQPSGCICKGKFYITGGITAASEYNTLVYAYDISANTWATVVNVDINLSKACAIYVNGNMHIISGMTSGAINPSAYKFNIVSASFCQDTDYINTKSKVIAGFLNDKIYATDLFRVIERVAYPTTFNLTSIVTVADNNILQGHILARLNDGRIVNKNTIFELSRDGGSNWSPCMMTENILSTDDMGVYTGLTNFDKTVSDINLDLTNGSVQNHRGLITQFTVDTANTSGHFDSTVTTALIGSEVVTASGTLIITGVTGSGTLVNNVTFSGTMAAGAYSVTAINKVKVTDGKIVPTSAPIASLVEDFATHYVANYVNVCKVGDEVFYLGNTPGSTTELRVTAYNILTKQWRECADMPVYQRGDIVAINGVIYLAGGYTATTQYSALVYAYNIATDTWTEKTSMPVATAGHTVSVVNNKIYAYGGGISGTSAVATLYCYDPTTNAWTALASNTVARYRASSIGVGNTIYVFGGRDVSAVYYNVLYAYDVSSNTWSTISSGGVSASLSKLFYINSKLYIVGGINSTECFDVIWCYDVVGNSWSKLYSDYDSPDDMYITAFNIDDTIYIGPFSIDGERANGFRSYNVTSGKWDNAYILPTNRIHAATCSNGKDIYISGGVWTPTYTTVSRTVFKRDAAVNTWSALAVLPVGLLRHSMVYYDNKLYVYGGMTFTGNSDVLYIYDMLTNTWSVGSEALLGTARYGACMCVISGKLYIVGGNTGSSVVSDTYECDIATLTVTAKTAAPTTMANAASVVANNKFYVTNGISNTSVVTGTYVYDPDTNVWTALTVPMNGTVAATIHQCSAVTDGTNIYLIGGYNYNSSTAWGTIYKYVISTNTWSITDVILASGRYASCAAIYDDRLFCMFGATSLGTCTLINEYVELTTRSRSSNTVIVPMDNSNVIDMNIEYSRACELYIALQILGTDGFTYFQIYVDGVWENIVRNSTGVWQYRTATGTWANSSTNTAEAAIATAILSSNNKMLMTELSDIYLYEIALKGIAISNASSKNMIAINTIPTRQVVETTIPEGKDVVYRISGSFDDIEPVIHGVRINHK